MDWKDNKLVWIIVALAAFNLLFIVGYKLVVKQVTNQVINGLQKEYSPGQAYPGIDPDKVNPSKSLFDELQKRQADKPTDYQEPPSADLPRPEMALEQNMSSNIWRDQWEKERGAVE